MRPFFSRLFPLLGLTAVLALFSCLGTPEKNTELVFNLDTSLVGDFDSLRVAIYATGDSTPELNRVIQISANQSEIKLGLPGNVSGNFTVVITGYDNGSEVYKKEFSYLAGETAPTGTPRNLLRIPPQGLSIADTTVSIYDTLSPVVAWTPAGTTERGFTISQRGSDTTRVSVLGSRVVARALGTADLMAVSDTAGIVDYFFVTVRPPEYATEIRPIVQAWCGKCHHPLAPINLQDSATLVTKGAQALIRLNLPVSDPNHMPADTVNRVLSPRDFNMLVHWLQGNSKPVTGLAARDTVIALGDSMLPALAWSPVDAGNRGYSLISSNTAKVSVSGNTLIANDTGWSSITATSQDGGYTATFRVTVGWPDFETRIRPITATHCTPCHAPGQTWNFQDSAVLIEHGGEAIRRVQLPKNATGHMPADTNITVPPLQLKALLGWLRAYVVPLVDVTVAPLTIRLGDTAAPALTWNPANVSNKNYTLLVQDTTYVVSRDGIRLIAKAVGTTIPFSISLRTSEGSLNRPFSVTVTPRLVDSIRGRDTSGNLLQKVVPRIRVFPANPVDSTWTLRSLNPSASILAPDTLVGLTLGSIASIEVTSNGNSALRDTFDFAVGFRVTSVRALDTNAAIGSIFSPRVIVSPTSATDRTYGFDVLDTSVTFVYDTVSGNPRLFAKSYGRTDVVVTTNDGAFTDTFSVTVVVAPPANLVYANDPVTYTTGTAITPNTPSVGGGAPTGYTVTPALPSGLTLSPSTGVISGTPTLASPMTAYVVTASNGTGSTTTTLDIAVTLAAPRNLTYSTNPASYNTNAVILPNQPSYTGGAPTNYTVNPALPAGLRIDASMGVISGTPTVGASPADYTITASNTSGSTTATVNIEVVVIIVPPANLTYTPNPATYTVGTAIAASNPSYSGGAPTRFSVAPALPIGLRIDTSTGVISGTPTAVTAAANYTVTATNSAGSTTASLNITVRVAAPANLTYSANPVTYTVGTSGGSNTPSSGGGAPTGYSVAPALPAGLALNPTTGVITGTPTTVTAAANYTVTAFNGTGSTTAAVNITVRVAAPASVTYSANPVAYSVGVPIVNNTPTYTGGAPTTYSVNPALPPGLTLNTINGVISGTPTSSRAAANYTVTASNGTGFITATVTITVNNIAAVSISFSPAIPTTLFVDSIYAPSILWNPINTTFRTFTLSTTTVGTIALPTATTFQTIYIGTGNITATSYDGPRTATASFNIVRPPFAKVSAILATRCITCHTPTSTLVHLDSLSAITGLSVAFPGRTVRSEIVRRVQLPLTDAQHMPANGTVLPAAEMNAMTRYFGW